MSYNAAVPWLAHGIDCTILWLANVAAQLAIEAWRMSSLHFWASGQVAHVIDLRAR